jgi:two-component system cell cycle sensor histidine kinase/response regulator CckA
VKTLSVKGIALSILLGFAFWIADSIYEFFMFQKNLEFMLYQEPLSFWDSLILNIPPHALFNRVSFLTACLLAGFIAVVFGTRWIASETRYQVLSDHFPNGALFRFDGQLRILVAGGEAIEQMGLSNVVIEGKTFQEIFPDGWKAILPHCREALAGKNSYLELRHEDRWYGLTTIPVSGVKSSERQGILVIHDITERKEAEQRLEEAYDIINRSSSVAFTWKNERGRPVEFVSENVVRLLGHEARELTGGDVDYLSRIHPDDIQRVENEVAEACGEEDAVEVHHEPYRLLTRDGTEKIVKDWTYIVRNDDGDITHYKGIVVDITEHEQAEKQKKSLEQQLFQAQKMESVGRLAGGVAHDYNNMLSIIMGYADLALSDTAPDSPVHKDLEEILDAAKRSSAITRQLLAFARRQTIDPKVLDLNETLDGMLKMLRRLIGEDIDLLWQPGDGLWPAYMDPSQLDQILANLLVNARDAIAGVGKITIETRCITFDEAYCADHGGFIPGDFVMVSVSDDGCGMDKETQQQIFEPFFTTKEMHKGTGLGLATVYGIVKQNSGFVNVYSEPQKGTTFRIYLPRHRGAAENVDLHAALEAPAGHGETVLVVEDEPSILKLTERVLESLGYIVLGATGPIEAITLAEEYTGEIHLLITDVVMPRMSGKELAEKLLRTYPDIKCLYMSGYTANVIAHHGVLDKDVQFINKPFSKQDLAAKVLDVLNGK